MKLTRRQRYILKWLGPGWNKRRRKRCRARCGKGDNQDRYIATAVLYRARGQWPTAPGELERRAGVVNCGTWWHDDAW